jgi:hypothetical protein
MTLGLGLAGYLAHNPLVLSQQVWKQEVILLVWHGIKEFRLGVVGSKGRVERFLECACCNVGIFGLIIGKKSWQNVQEFVVIQEFHMEPLPL